MKRLFILLSLTAASLGFSLLQDDGQREQRDSRHLYPDDPENRQRSLTQNRPNPNNYILEPPKYVEDEFDQQEHGSSIPGQPGKDYPILSFIPETGFSCSEKLPGFYADDKANCQVWHYCKTDGARESFLCPNGTVYHQENRVCEWWFNVKCELSAAAYRVNEDLYTHSQNQESKAGKAEMQHRQNQDYKNEEYENTQDYYPSY